MVRFNGTTGEVQNSGVVIDDRGNVGVGVIPSGWYTGYTKAIEIGTAQDNGTIWSSLIQHHSHIGIGANFYMDNSFIPKYKASYAASQYSQSNGNHLWQIAPSGTAGNSIPWTNAMTLNSSGNLLVGTTTDNGVDKLQVNGSISSLSNLVADNFITGTFTAGSWYNTGITSHTVAESDFSTLFGINIFEDSYNTSNGNYINVYTFITGPYSNPHTNSFDALPLSIVSRTGHAFNGTLSMRWLSQPYHTAAVLQFSLSKGGTFDSTSGKTLRIKIKKIN